MKHFFTIAILFAATITSYSQSLGYQDLALLFSENDENGSARFIGMSGAFGALGGDISSVSINPAGIAVYKNSAFSGTFNSRSTDITSNYYNNTLTTQEQFFNISHAGAVLVFDSAYNSKWNKFAIGFNYRITKDFNNGFLAQGNSGIATFTEFPIDQNTIPIDYNIAEEQRFSNTTNGELSEINVAFSSVHENKLYIGAGFNAYDLNFTQRSTLRESNTDGNNNNLRATLYQENNTIGTGFSLNAGFIYKAHKNFRFGLAYQSPTWFTEIIEETNIIPNEGSRLNDIPFLGDTEILATEDTNNIYNNTAGDFFPGQSLIYRLKTPSKLTASAAFIFGKNGLLSIDYSNKSYTRTKLTQEDFSQENQFFQNDLRNTHNLNIGTEWRLDRFSIRGGYKFEQSPLKNASDIENVEGYSFGGGYNFGDTKLDISYSDSSRNNSYNFYSQYSNINAAGLITNNKTITATLTLNL
jgi:hypothetical protein